jgi:CRISPR-associated protein Cmr1
MLYRKITFECEVITPMFLAGADGSTPELRPPSIKGALRFWWRALNGHLPLHELKQKEDEIFGGTDGRSKFSLRVICDDFEPSFDEFNQSFKSYEGSSNRRKGFATNAMFYLGYGVANYDKEIKGARFMRPYIPSGTHFTVKIRGKNSLTNEILKSFKVLEQYSGLGSKSRNAFGCFHINKCIVNGESIDLDNVNIENEISSSLSPFTAFSEKVNVFETKQSFNTWEQAFKNIAESYQYARERIDEWHDWYWRELIALPIIVRNERDAKANFLERHSKPYFMHIRKTNDGYKGEVFLLPYLYLIDCGEINQERVKEYQKDYFEALDRFNNLLSEKLNLTLENALI